MKTVKVGIIGGGLMGREVAICLGRWFTLLDFPVKLEPTAVCDVQEKVREWFRQVRRSERRKEQVWERYDVEREGALGDRFSCVPPDEAVASHELFAAALQSHAQKRSIECGTGSGQ